MSAKLVAAAVPRLSRFLVSASAVVLSFWVGCYESLDPRDIECTVGNPRSCPKGYVCRVDRCTPIDGGGGAFSSSDGAAPDQPGVPPIDTASESGRDTALGNGGRSGEGGIDGSGDSPVDVALADTEGLGGSDTIVGSGGKGGAGGAGGASGGAAGPDAGDTQLSSGDVAMAGAGV